MQISSAAIGRAGEYLAAAAIELQGWQCIYTPAEGFDVVATQSNKFLRVQVKSSLRVAPGRRTYQFTTAHGSRTKQHTSLEQADIFALVALDIRKVYFIPVKFTKGVTVRIKASEYAPFIEAQTWHHSVNNVIGSQWSD